MILRLLKVNIAAIFASILRGTKNKRSGGIGSKILVGILLFYTAAVCLLLFTVLFFNMSGVFFRAGIGWLYFAIAALIVFFICVVTCIFQAQATVFNAKDNMILLPMPIRPFDILAARILSMLIPEYLFESLVTVPAIAVWIAGGYSSVFGIVLSIIGFILLPMLAMSVATALAWILSLVTSRMRHRTAATVVVSMLFMLLLLYFSSNMQHYMTGLVEKGNDLAESINRSIIFAPAYHFGLAASEASLAHFMIFAASALIPFLFIMWMLSRGLFKILTTNRGVKKTVYISKDLKGSKTGTALLKRELQHFSSNPMIIMNTCMGPLLSLIIAVLLVVKAEVLEKMLGVYGEMLGGFNMQTVAVILLLFCVTTCAASGALISIEGKCLWILRSIPASGRSVLKAKINLHLLLCGVPIFIASAVAAIGTGSDAVSLLTLLITPVIFVVFIAYAGLSLNLLKPRFDWINDIQPLKQGMPVITIMFGSWGILITVGLLYGFFLRHFINLNYFLLIFDAAVAAITVLLARWLYTVGQRRWDEL